MNIKSTLSLGLSLALLGSTSATALGQVKVDKALPEYKKTANVSGTIKSVGSDTMNNLMALWGGSFGKVHPAVQIEVEGKGSGTAPPALIKGTATFGPMSRRMKSEEIDEFKEAYGYEPTALPTSIDMLAVYVHKDNPIASLSLQQVDAIFSKTRGGGFEKNITTWGDVGLEGEWSDKPISLYGRNSASGTYGYFKQNALFKGDYKDEVKEQPGSSAVVQGVANDKYAIGYSGIGYKTADVRAIPLAQDHGGEAVAAEPANAYSGDYPLARFLLVYVNYKQGQDLDPLRAEFIRYIYSQQGQESVIEDGYFPVTARIAARALQSVGMQLPVIEAGAPR